METSFELIGQFRNHDSQKNIFKLVDEVGSNFQDRLQDVQDKQEEDYIQDKFEKKRSEAPKHYSPPWEAAQGSQRFENPEEFINSHLQKDSNTTLLHQKFKEIKSKAKEGDVNLEKESSQEESGESELTESIDLEENKAPKTLQLNAQEQALVKEQLSSLSVLSQQMMTGASEKMNHLLQDLQGKSDSKNQIKQDAQGKVEDSSLEKKQSEVRESKSKSSAPAREISLYEKMKQKVVDQVRVQMKLALKEGKANVQLRLNPQMLGQVKIQLQMEDSQTQASLQVENQTVKDFLLDNLDQLRQSLEEQGLDVGDLDVFVKDEESNSQKQGQGRGFISTEERESFQEWMNSMKYLEEETVATRKVENSEEEDSQELTYEGDELVNIIA